MDLDQYYPKLRVRNSWDFENQTPRTLVFAGSKCLDRSTNSFTSHNSDGQSCHSDENFFQLPDFDENSLPTDSSSPRLSVRIPNFDEIDLHQEETKEHSDGNSDDLFKEVRCIEVEEQSTKRPQDFHTSDISPKRSLNSNVSSPQQKTAITGLTVVKNEDSVNEELGSPTLKKNKDLNSLQTGFLIPSPENPSQWLLDKELSGFAYLKLTRSRSCKARLNTNSYSHWFEREEKDECTPPIIFEKSFTGRPEGLQMKVPSLNYGAEIETLKRNGSQEVVSRNDSQKTLSRNNSQTTLWRTDSQKTLSRNGSQDKLSRNGSRSSAGSAAVDEFDASAGSVAAEELQASAGSVAADKLEAQDIKSSNDDENSNITIAAGEIKETADFPSEKTLADSEVRTTLWLTKNGYMDKQGFLYIVYCYATFWF